MTKRDHRAVTLSTPFLVPLRLLSMTLSLLSDPLFAAESISTTTLFEKMRAGEMTTSTIEASLSPGDRVEGVFLLHPYDDQPDLSLVIARQENTSVTFAVPAADMRDLDPWLLEHVQLVVEIASDDQRTSNGFRRAKIISSGDSRRFELSAIEAVPSLLSASRDPVVIGTVLSVEKRNRGRRRFRYSIESNKGTIELRLDSRLVVDAVSKEIGDQRLLMSEIGVNDRIKVVYVDSFQAQSVLLSLSPLRQAFTGLDASLVERVLAEARLLYSLKQCQDARKVIVDFIKESSLSVGQYEQLESAMASYGDLAPLIFRKLPGQFYREWDRMLSGLGLSSSIYTSIGEIRRLIGAWARLDTESLHADGESVFESFMTEDTHWNVDSGPEARFPILQDFLLIRLSQSHLTVRSQDAVYMGDLLLAIRYLFHPGSREKKLALAGTLDNEISYFLQEFASRDDRQALLEEKVQSLVRYACSEDSSLLVWLAALERTFSTLGLQSNNLCT